MRWHSAAGLLGLSLCLAATLVSETVAQELLSDQECKPGSEFKRECNWCVCNERGIAGCTLKGCIGNFREPDGEQCKGDAVWKKDCNVCNCANGNAVCTRKACAQVPITQSTLQEGQECTSGVRYKIECNWCTCGTRGTAACTLRGCIGGPRDPDGEQCEGVGEWRRGCNTCTCVDGKAFCTKKACPGDSVAPDVQATLEEGQQCKPGSRFKIDCNWCTCSSRGTAGCTYRGCLGNYRSPDGEQCEGDAVWRKDCNICNCVNGNAVCTKKACPSGRSVHGAEEECSAGSLWRRDCNTCRCTNGRASCTRMQCRPGFSRNPDQPECEEGSRWKVDCNWCICSKGKGLCTQKGCRGQAVVTQEVQTTTLEEGQQCKPGSRFKKECNWCFCTPTGIAGCTLIGCIGNYRNPDGEQCEGDAVWRKDCNICNCVNGNAVCTKKACPGSSPRQLPVPIEAECTEGSVWHRDCNTCRCTKGVASCTRMQCRPGFTRDPDQPECEDGSRWKKDCNWCNCENGKGFCTLKACSPPVRRPPPGKEECTKGSVWFKECNRCFCSNGLGACTRKGCPPGYQRSPDQPECEGDSRWKKDCNWCTCVDGRGVCTQKGCGVTRGAPRRRQGPLEPEKQCTPGSVWYKGCNTCRCANGLSVCTKMACPPGFVRGPEDRECEGESSWKKDCNWCKCSNGKVVCTFKACAPDFVQHLPAPSDKDHECTAGSVWYEDCNTCRCANGLKVCTRNACPPGFTRGPEEPECEGESSWKKDCNWCNCVKGKGACTRKGCLARRPQSVPGGPPLAMRRESECSEGSVWYKGCNTCRCASGFSVCTRKACPPDFVHESDGIPKCEGDAHFKHDCNWCNCVEGKGACTKMACRPQFSPQAPAIPEGECTEGSVWYDECNRCHCTNGVKSCTRMACRPGFTRNPDQPECEGKSRWKKDCNWCTCDNGKAACTLKGCLNTMQLPAGRGLLGRTRGGAGPSQGGPQCQGTPEDGRWRKDCNWCSCSGGNAICTQRGCLPGFREQMKDTPECEGNARWKKDCNFCHCTNGVASCTRRACRPPGPAADAQAVCTEGSHWRVGCNWCTCANGVAACTRTLCPEETNTEEPECTEGSRWRRERSQCMCVEGKSVCTRPQLFSTGSPSHRSQPSRQNMSFHSYSAPIHEVVDVCNLPPIRKSQIQCAGFFRKWTYKAEERSCEAIVYGGCGGTENLFDDLETCEATCGAGAGAARTDLIEGRPADDAECTEGSIWYDECNRCHCTNGVKSCTRKRCRPGFTRDLDQPECNGESQWLKDCNWCKCVKGRGLCTQMACASDLGDLQVRPERCFRSPEAGPCFALMRRFAFVPERDRCEMFFFGGCRGNDNNFETPEECQQTCWGDQPVLDASCDRSECPWKRFEHYMAKGCTAVYANLSCCPTSFECPPVSSLLAGPADKCIFDGHEYAVGEEVTTRDPCSAGCQCRPGHGDERPKVTCANVECPELFRPRDPNCRGIYSLDKCCAVEEECQDPNTPQVAVTRGVTCSWNNQTYKQGDKMYFDGKFACRKCICTADFTDPNGLGCDDVYCGLELRNKERMIAGCVPIYFEDSCCPIEWLCPGDPKLPTSQSIASQVPHGPGRCPARSRSEEPSFGICAFTCNEDSDCFHGKKCCSTACGGTTCVEPVHDDPVESGRACRLGDLTVALGEKVPLEGDCKTLCTCSTPPELTCVRYRSCELAAQRDTGCHDITCQEGCEVRLNATTHCQECHCPGAQRAAFSCPAVHCPDDCRSTVLKQDLATGCTSCHCDTCPPKDPITGRPPCPMDCAVEVTLDQETGCEVCTCTSSTRPMGPPTPCPRLPPGGKLPCPSDCPAGTHTIKDPETHCLRCVCVPADGSTNQAIFLPDDDRHCFVDPITGVPPCPMDCATRLVKDEHGCDKCECDPNTPPLYPFHQAPQ